MKRCIKSTESERFSNQDIINMLNDNNIDTTIAKYELSAIEYQRYSDGPHYAIKFSCPGDWLAYFSMLIHACPNAKNFYEHGYRLNDLSEYVEEYSTPSDIKDHASINWWGDGDDFIIYLKNLSTGQYLYGPEGYDEEDWND